MTVAEEKVKELCEKLLKIIDESPNSPEDDSQIVSKIECYLSGVSDGIDLSEEMRQPDFNVQAKVGEERPMVGNFGTPGDVDTSNSPKLRLLEAGTPIPADIPGSCTTW